jgi:uncharacterized membrane protein YdcZ (DUF606 family)
MGISADPVVGINFFLCLVILVMGYGIYTKRENFSALLIGIAFGLFGLSHLIQLFGITGIPETTFLLTRICGYILVIAALWLVFLSE